MISFTELCASNFDKIASSLASEISGADIDEINEILTSFEELSSEEVDTSVAISHSNGCLLVRIFDFGRYCFVYPIALVDDADEVEAVNQIRLYAIKEEIPLVFSDTPGECVGNLVSTFRYTEASAEDREASSYRVTVKSECSLLDEIPTLEYDELTLSAISDTDFADYATLCRDFEVNKYWGYDFSEDSSDPDDPYFLETAQSELSRGVAASFALRLDGEFIGEALLYAFDFLGGAECGFRILKEYQGRGLGKATLEALLNIAERIGLVELRATVMEQNTVSKCLISQYMDEVSRADGRIYYKLEI